jgi:hypothetical protein
VNIVIRYSWINKGIFKPKMEVSFSKLLDWTLQEYEIYKANNIPKVHSLPDFLDSIPLGVIYKNAHLNIGTDFNQLLDYINAPDWCRFSVLIELIPLDEFKTLLHDLETGKRKIEIYDKSITYWTWIYQASMRGRDDIVEYLYSVMNDNIMFEHMYLYYPASQKLQDIFVKHEPKFIEKLGCKDYDVFVSGELSSSPLNYLLFLTTSFQEQDVFIRNYLKYHYSVPEAIMEILYNPDLKYNIQIHNRKLKYH